MIEKLEDLGFLEEDTIEQIDVKLQEKLGVSIATLQEPLSRYMVENAEVLTHDFPNVAPMGDYSKLLEDNDGIAEFFKTEGHKPEHWKLDGINLSEVVKTLLTFEFHNVAIDDGESCSGFVYVSFDGKIKHAFAQWNE